MSAGELVVTERRSAALEVAEAPGDPVLALMNKLASNESLSPEKVQALMDVYVNGHRKMQEIRDEQAFAAAMADFKKNPPKIVKNRKAKLSGTARSSGREYNYEYSYADLNAYCEEAMPLMAERGITWSFPFTEENGDLVVSCVLRYGLYTHTPTTMRGKPEGGNNPLQAKGVTVAYLERYTFAGATGLTAAMPDNDGRAQAQHTGDELSEKVVLDFLASIEGSGDISELERNYFKAKDAADQAKDGDALTKFANMKNQMYKKLAKGQK